MIIRHAKTDEIDEVMKIYEKAAVFMAEHGNPTQWVGYPDRKMIMEDIDREELYICEKDGETAAVFMYSEGDDPVYRNIEGAWKNDRPYGVVHRIASSQITRGAGRFCIEWAIEKCKNLKIDTHEDNTPMKNLLNSMKFEYCGIVHMPGGEPRIAFQKNIE